MVWWTRIVGALGLLVAATFLIQWLAPRGRDQGIARQRYLRRDIAPIVGFFGAVLLALSLAEAVRRDVIAQWGWGIAFGLLIGAGVGALLFYRRNRAPRASVWQFLRRYGALTIAIITGVYLAVRVFGAALEMFVAAALGMFVVAAAAAIFVRNKTITEEK